MNASSRIDAPTWGAKVTTSRMHRGFAAECPQWATKRQRARWYHHGVHIWDHLTQNLAYLPPDHALIILDRLRNDTAWQQQGTTVGNTAIQCAPDQPTLDGPMIFTSSLPLDPTQTQQLVTLLMANESDLRETSVQGWEAAWRQAGRAVLALLRTRMFSEARKVDLSTRRVEWSVNEDTQTWSCSLPPFQGNVTLVLHQAGWQGSVFWRDLPTARSLVNRDFAEVLHWVEEAILRAAQQEGQKVHVIPELPAAPRRRLSPGTVTRQDKARLRAFWIDPATLDVRHPTYRSVLRVTVPPLPRTIDGRPILPAEARQLPFEEQVYPAPDQLCQRLRIDRTRMICPIKARGYFRFSSVTSYADAMIAEVNTARLWDESDIGAQYQAEQIVTATYGIEEVESGYVRLLGGCGEWRPGYVDRTEFIVRRALELTLLNALDVDRYRDLNDIRADELDDEQVIRIMHRQRVTAWGIPIATREESRRWLVEHALEHAST
jgi:hypothetical protein